jgi:predicted AAA+ superfamily ATPase
LEKKIRHRYFIISGSNASLLGGKLGTALTGRHLDMELFPFSLSEYKLLKASSTFDDYFIEGGFPRPIVHENGPALLREYFNDIIDRDVRRHVAARSSEALRQVAKAVFESTGSETSLRKLSNFFDLSPDTVKTYLDGLVGAYLILPCPFFTYSERQRAVRPKKYYPIDLGLHAAVATKTGVDKGKKLETLVFHHLKKEYLEVYYWKGTREVDLVVETKKGLLPIQVSWEEMKERHQIAADEFKEQFPDSLPVKFITRSNIEQILVGTESIT